MLVEKLHRQGAWLFRWRSFLPLVFIPIALWALQDAEGLDASLGDRLDDWVEALAMGISLAGIAVRIYTVGHVPRSTSGRNTHQQRAATLNQTGLYSVVRHPLYLGNFLIILGLLLSTALWHLTIIGILAFALYYERIMLAEEAFLQQCFQHEYRHWSRGTPAFVPKPSLWRKPALPFSWRMVFRREISTWLAYASAMLLIDIAEELIAEHRLEIDPEWVSVLIVLIIAYGVVRYARKTGWLRPTNR